MQCCEACFPPHSPQPSPTQHVQTLLSEFSFLKHACSVTRSCPTLCDPMDSSPPGSSVHGILQERILGWIAISISRDLLNPRIEPASPALADGFFFFTTGKFLKPRAFLFFSRESFRAFKYSSHDPHIQLSPNLPLSLLFPLSHTVRGCLCSRHWRYSTSSSVSPSQLSLRIVRVTWNLGLSPLPPVVFSTLVTASSRALLLLSRFSRVRLCATP